MSRLSALSSTTRIVVVLIPAVDGWSHSGVLEKIPLKMQETGGGGRQPGGVRECVGAEVRDPRDGVLPRGGWAEAPAPQAGFPWLPRVSPDARPALAVVAIRYTGVASVPPRA